MPTDLHLSSVVYIAFPNDATVCAQAAMLAAEAWARCTGATTNISEHVPGNGAWTMSDVQALARCRRDDAANAAFNHIAGLSGGYSSQEELVEVSGLPLDNLNAQLRWLGRHAKLVRGVAGWPLLTKTDDEGHTAYGMPPQISEWWLSA